MSYPHVTELYMYKSPNDNTLNILRNRCLWAAKPEHFNDPFDCDLEISVCITEDVMLESMRQRGDSESAIDEYKKSNLSLDGKFAPEELRRVDNLIQKLIKENKNMGVVCLSEVCDSILMWSHYAEKHRGVCFEFTRSEDNALGDLELCSPVKYDRYYPIIDLGQILLKKDGTTLERMMRSKSGDWAYEKEWRLTTPQGDREYPLPGPISRVILGIKIDDPFKSDIKDLCQERNIPCVQARKIDREFRIEVPSE